MKIFRVGIIYTAVFLLLGLLTIVKADAYTLSPASGNLVVGNTYTITVRATPGDPGNDTSAEVQLIRNNSNITVTGATPSPNGTLAAGVCNPSGTFLANAVCFIYGDNTGIATNEVLGTFTIQANAVGTATLSVNSTDPAYEPSGDVMSGVLATFNIVAAGTNVPTLPNTSFTSSALIDAVLLFLGVSSITFGLYFYYLPKKTKFFYKVPHNSVNTKYEYDVLRKGV